MQRNYTSIRFVAPLSVRLSQTFNSILFEMETIISYHSVSQFSLAPLVFRIFNPHFQIVFPCRNRLPDTMLYMAAVAKAAATSKFDLSCRPLSAQRAFLANTRDARTNLMSRFVWSSVNCVRSTFDDYRYIIPGTTFISYAMSDIV